MVLTSLTLKNFRNHINRYFDFSKTSIIIGKNTAGKTNILEAIYVLSHGKSFRTEKDFDLISEKHDFARVEGVVESDETTKLVSILAKRGSYLSKKYMVNGVARSLKTFSDYLYTVLFTPQDIEIITGAPSLRRKYIDSILTKSHKEYRSAINKYEKALRQRNRMLHDAKRGLKVYKRQDYEYWENLLIEHGGTIHNFRKEFVNFVNASGKEVFSFQMHYDHSIISTERLYKYHFEETSAGVTLVGPQRDDFKFLFSNSQKVEPSGKNPLQKGSTLKAKEVKEFGSRGEQRMTILQMKLVEIDYLKRATNAYPILLLDDIFSELDSDNIDKIYNFIEEQQTIITTTHKEFVPKKILKRVDLKIIEL
jgi:DNA replication and repair protein RecF